MKRGKQGQLKHDNKVAKELTNLKEQGFRVWADLPGRTRPPKIKGIIPDIYARKGKKLIVEEIETKATIQTDKEQQKKLKEGTKEKGGVFKIKIAI